MSRPSIEPGPAGDVVASANGSAPSGGARTARSQAPRSILSQVVGVLGGFGLAVVLLILLTVLVLAGTLEQKSMSLFDVQRKYFDSLFVIARLGPVPVPMPGATVLLAVLFVNLVVGGVIRIRKKKSTVGILIAHGGILFLLLGGFVEAIWSDKGFVDMREGESASAFKSYFEWEIAVVRRPAAGTPATVREYVLDSSVLGRLDPSDSVRFRHADLPFDVAVSGWVRNADVQRARDAGEQEVSVEGWLFADLGDSKTAENNTPGAVVSLISKSGAPTERSLLWGFNPTPWVVLRADQVYELHLRRRTWSLPFSVHLKKFVKRDHPGTGMAAEFSSYVTKVENGVARDSHITMNEPLRSEGYTFYQSGFREPASAEGRWSSTFAVVKNPADRWPIAACVVIAIGLGIHLLRKLFIHIMLQARSRAASGKAAA